MNITNDNLSYSPRKLRRLFTGSYEPHGSKIDDRFLHLIWDISRCRRFSVWVKINPQLGQENHRSTLRIFLWLSKVYGVDSNSRPRFSVRIAFYPNKACAVHVIPHWFDGEIRDKMITIRMNLYDKKRYQSMLRRFPFNFRSKKLVNNRFFVLWSSMYWKECPWLFTNFKLEFAKSKLLSKLLLIKTINIINNHVYSIGNDKLLKHEINPLLSLKLLNDR